MENRLTKKTIPDTPPFPPKVTAAKCPICGSDSVVGDADKLCWVCRRLKVSAWRDSDHSMPAQE